MPTFEYYCEKCKALFEEILILPDDIKQYSQKHPCGKCHELASRVPISLTSPPVFKAPAGQTQGSGVHGQSGSHDLDYPTLDKAIGRSSEKKWAEYAKRKSARDQIRKESGTNAISTAGGRTAPVDPAVLKLRETGLNTLSKGKRTARKPPKAPAT
jgi:hypothetical protein